jgi:hypothetical protein
MANRRFIDFPIAASVGDNDIVLIWQDGLNKQTTKATLLQGSPSSLAGLTDVDIAALTNGQILQYNSTTSKWENVDRTDINLSELGDVTIVAPANGQVLVYNSSTSKWENSSAGYVPYTGAVTTVNLGAQSILAGSFVRAGGTSAQFLKADGSVDSSTYGTGTVTSVALTMPTAFSVANSPVTTAGTLAVTATGTTAQYIRGDGSLETFPALTGFVPYTGATADVNLGAFDLLAERGTFENNGSSNTITVNHTSGSGYGIIVTKGGNNEALYVSKTSGSGNAMTVVGGRTSLVDLALSSVTNTAGDFLTLSGGVVHKRTAAQTLTDIGGQAALTNPVTGTGTTNYLPKFTGSTTIGNSALQETSGNLGLGVTPSAWSLGKVIEIGQAGSAIWSTGTSDIRLLGNAYYDGAWRYAGSNLATQYHQNAGVHYWYNAPSGTAGNAITFTQAMTLTAAGRLLINTPSESTFQLDVNGTGRFVNGVNMATTSGSVGIGTGSPASKLDINIGILSTAGAFNNAALNLYNPTNIGAYSQITFGYTIGATYASSYLGFVSTNQGSFGFGDLVFGTRSVNTDTQATERMRITSAGDLIFKGRSTTTNYEAVFYNDNSQLAINANNTNVGKEINFNHRNDLTAMRITSGGNVLIGTTDDNGAKFQLRQTAFAWASVFNHTNATTQFYMDIQYNGLQIGSIMGNNTSASFNTSSDYRLKTDLKDYNGLDLVSKIKTYDFAWKTDKSRSFGVIAHELQEVINYAVTGRKDGDFIQGVDYSKLVPIMVKAIQELKQEIDTLKN